jgi:hypothetical protein
MLRVSLRRNGTNVGGKALVPDTLEELLAVATAKLDLAPSVAKKIFFADGDEFVAEDLELVSHDDVLYVSCGEKFIPPNADDKAVPVEQRKNGAKKGSRRLDIDFRATIFERSYHLHMVIFGVCALLVANMYRLTTEFSPGCQAHPTIAYLLPAFLAVFAGSLWRRYRQQQALTTHPMPTPTVPRKLAKDGADDSNAAAQASLLQSRSLKHAFFAFSALMLPLVFVDSGNVSDDPAIDALTRCTSDDLWRDALPVFFAHIGVIALLLGVLCSTLMMVTYRLYLNSSLINLCFFVVNIRLYGWSSVHTLSYAIGCHLVQHASFYVGVYVGDALMHMQRRTFDEVSLLRIKLLKSRVEQLQREKERINYEARIDAAHDIDLPDVRALRPAGPDVPR